MAIPITQQAADASINDSNKPRRSSGQQVNMSLRGPTGPTTQRGKQKSRRNATKHGIFSVGIVRKRESEAEYLRIVEDMVETLQPAGRLEEILVEKLAMLVWRYRRLLQAEVAEVARQREFDRKVQKEGETQAAETLVRDEGLLPGAVSTENHEAVCWAIEILTDIQRLIREKGLNWERDREALKMVYGCIKEQGEDGHPRSRVVYEGKGGKGPDPFGPLATRYREFAGTAKDKQSATDTPRNAAESIVRMLTDEIDELRLNLRGWRVRTVDHHRLHEPTALVPRQEVTDRLQRYEGSLDRSFDRTLSQLERLQRLRLGQPVLPALKVDVSH
jgi:hypothetical protein